MWYKAANETFVTLYHGTSRENYLLMKRSGVLRKSDVPNLTTSKELAKAFGKQFFEGDETVILSFVLPRNLIEGHVGTVVTTVSDIPMKYMKGIEKFDSLDASIGKPADIRHRLDISQQVEGWTAEQERMAVEKMRELERNPKAYIPAWMRNDNRFRGKV